jgi:DNA polymerase-3 subunit epsilon
VRELRLIAAHAPPYNRRSKYPERVVWLKLTAEAYPRLSLVRAVAEPEAAYLGPFSSRRVAELAAAGVHDAVPLRQCTLRLSTRTKTPACALAELGKCPAPCEHRISAEDYLERAATPFRDAITGDPTPLVDPLLARIRKLSDARRYEEAAVVRTRMAALLRAAVRMQRLSGLTSIAELVAARRHQATGGWELAIVRHGRLVAAGVSPPRVHPRSTIDMLRITAETVIFSQSGQLGADGPQGEVATAPSPTPAASAGESERILSWLERPDTRLVQMSAGWTSPVRGAARFRDLLFRAEKAASGKDSTESS